MVETTEQLKNQLMEAIRRHQSGQIQEAEAIYELLLKQFPGHPYILYLYGLARQDLGDWRGAMDLLSHAVAREPDNAIFLLALGIVLKHLGHSRAALERFREVQRRQPEQAEAHFYLGDTHMDLGEAAAAIPFFQAAIPLRPVFPEAWINLGLCLKACGRLEEALHCFRQVVAEDPYHIAGHVNLGLTHLLMGDYGQGWPEYEWRLQATGQEACLLTPDLLHTPQAPPRWDGSPLRGKTILILAEQGFGDILQCVRYLSLLKTAGARLLFTCPWSLIPLLRTLPEIDQITTPQAFAYDGPIDWFSPLLSLPMLLQSRVETIPAEIPYVQADPDRVHRWNNRLGNRHPWRIGLVWRGKPLHRNDPLRRRSCTWDDLAPLAQVAGVTWVGLQKGEEGLQPVSPHPGMDWIDLHDALPDFAQTAAVLANLDLLITIDTSVAHLAGALGKPVWVLLPLVPDWRWSLDGESTPWYPTARLFRQTVPNCWRDPIQKMVIELPRFLSAQEEKR